MKKENVKCIVCGTQQTVYISRVRTYKTCSIECRTKLLRKKPHYKCVVCDKEFHVKPYRVKRLKNNLEITCSKKCGNVLKSERYTGRKNPNTKYFMINDNMFKTVDSEDKAYLLGWIASDGHISENGVITIQIHEDDKDILVELGKVVFDEYDIKNDLGRMQVMLRFCSKVISEDVCKLLNISSGKKSHIVSFPSLDNEKLSWAFLRGYFDGDGTIHKIDDIHSSPYCSITSNSNLMLEGIKNFCNIPCHINQEHGTISWSGNNCLDFLGKLYSNKSKYRLQRKFEKYIDISTWVPTISSNGSWKNEYFKWSKTRPDAIAPSKTRVSDSGFDLTILEKVKTFGEVELYDTGIKIKPSFGYYFDIVPRSSIIKSGYMLANSVGIIDRTYLGNIMVALIKIDKSAPDLTLPNKIVQLIPRHIIHVDFEEVKEEQLGETDRGDGGFGSTNKK